MSLPRPAQTLLATLPLPVVRGVANLIMRSMIARHPQLFDRLGTYASARFCIVPTDTRFEFLVLPWQRRVEVRRPGRTLRSDVRIAGPLLVLLSLAEGRIDGDAEFFGRTLAIEGDMEAALALRNALEDANLDFVRDVTPVFGPLGRPAQLLLDRVRAGLLAREGR